MKCKCNTAVMRVTLCFLSCCFAVVGQAQNKIQSDIQSQSRERTAFTNGEVTLSVSYDGPVSSPTSMTLVTGCEQFDVAAGTITVENTSIIYEGVGRIHAAPNSNGTIIIRLSVTIGTASIVSAETLEVVSGEEGRTVVHRVLLNLFSGIELQLPGTELVSGTEIPVYIEPLGSNTSCVPGIVFDGVPITLSVFSGSEYGQLTKNGELVGATTELLYNDGQMIGFLADGEFPAGNPGVVTIEATVGELTTQQSFSIIPLAQIELIPETIEMMYGTTQTLFFRELDSYGNDILNDDWRLITLTCTPSLYGHFLDTNGEQVSGSLTTFSNHLREGRISFSADGEIAETTVTVTLTASTTGVNDFSVEITILPPPTCVVMTIEPDTLTRGDTATITFKRRTPRGIIEEFPPERRYAIYIYDGMDYGTLLNPENGTTSNFLVDVPQGVKFIAYQEIVIDTPLVIQLVADTIAEIFPASLSKKKKDEVMLIGENGCEMGEVVINECVTPPDAMPCPIDEPPLPEFNTFPQSNNFQNIDVCDSEEENEVVEIAAFGTTLSFQPIITDVCFDEEKGQWKVFFLDVVWVDVIKDFCKNYNFIDNLDEAGLIPSEQEGCARKDFRGHRDYPIKVSYEFYLREALQLHEDMHEEDYQTSLICAIEQIVKEVGWPIKLDCNEYSTLESARNEGLNRAKSRILSMVNKANQLYKKEYDNLLYERSINASPRMNEIIQKYIRALGTIQSTCY